MKINGFGTIGGGGNVNKKRGASAAGMFSDLLSAAETHESEVASSASDVNATAALSNLLALQEISEEDVHRRKMVQHGYNMLDELDKLRKQILGGVVPAHTLQEIARQLSLHKQGVVDPQLMAIMEDIELRTAVELAKLEMAAASVANPVANPVGDRGAETV